MGQAHALNENMKTTGWKEPELLLGQYADILKAQCEAISAALDTLDAEALSTVQKEMFFTLTTTLVKKMNIHSPLFARDIMNYFKAIIAHLLPLRLHDATFVNMVTDDILDNKKLLWSKDSMNDTTSEWEKLGMTPKIYLNRVAVQERMQQTNEE